MAELSGREMNEASQKHLCGHCAYTLRHYARHACVTCKLRKAQKGVYTKPYVLELIVCDVCVCVWYMHLACKVRNVVRAAGRRKDSGGCMAYALPYRSIYRKV